MPGRQKRTVFVVSDASGGFGHRAIESARQQFPAVDFQERLYPETRTIERLREIFIQAEHEGALVIFTLVDQALVDQAHLLAAERRVPAIDLMGELIPGIARWTELEPSKEPGHRIGRRYNTRARAVDFATRHDDGKNADGLLGADVVVLGLSRASKTPVCHELAIQLLKAGNIPIVMAGDQLGPLPSVIEQIHPKRVVVLTVEQRRLMQLRASRAPSLGEEVSTQYASADQVREEIRQLNVFLQRHPDWLKIDVTRRSIEETAAYIIAHLQEYFPK